MSSPPPPNKINAHTLIFKGGSNPDDPTCHKFPSSGYELQIHTASREMQLTYSIHDTRMHKFKEEIGTNWYGDIFAVPDYVFRKVIFFYESLDGIIFIYTEMNKMLPLDIAKLRKDGVL